MILEIIFGAFFFVLGAVVGSFLNVVILRHNTGYTPNGRSMCLSCMKSLTWVDLVPILSFIALRGKCRKCESNIAIQYPLVELFTALLFFLTYIEFMHLDISGFVISMLFYLAIISLLVVIVVYDLRHKIIPDKFVYAFIALSFVGIFVDFPLALFSTPSSLLILAGPIMALPFAILWFVSKGKWMGFGDAKLALGIGWLLGLIPATSAIVLAFWIGAVVSLLMLALKSGAKNKRLSGSLRRFTIKSEVPFAPFLVLGLLIVFFLNINVFSLEAFL